MAMVETHPFNGKIPEGTRLLIVGTAPPPRFSNPALRNRIGGLDFEFFYGSKENYMWEFLDQIAEHVEGQNLFEEATETDKCCEIARNFLQRHGIWMHDVLQTYQRKEGREDKAGDDDIVPPPNAKFTSFEAALKVQSIVKLAFTSEKAAEWTISALEQEGLLTTPEHYKNALSDWRGVDSRLPILQYIQRKFKQPFVQGNMVDRDFHFYILPSPSGNSAQSAMSGFGPRPEAGHL